MPWVFVVFLKERKMSRISYPRMKRIMYFLPLLLLLAFFLVGCGNRNSASQTTTTTNTQSSTTTQNGSSSDDATSVQNGDQQAQNLLQSLDKAQQDADNASNSGDQQDTNQIP
jgi:hypothetical protein